MKKCDSCTSCGMPFRQKSDYALGDENSPFCSHCTKSDGSLKTYEEVLEGTKGYFIHYQGVAPEKAEKMAEDLIKNQPAWKNR